MRDIIIGASLSAFAGWAVAKLFEKTAQEIQWNFDGIGLDGIGLTDGVSVNIQVRIRIVNNMNIDIPIQRFQAVLTWQGKDFVPVKSVDYAVIKAKETTILRYIVPVKMAHVKAVFGSFEAFKQALRPNNWRMRGFAEIRKGSFIQKVTFDEGFVIAY